MSEKSIHQSAVDVAVNGETVIDVVCESVDETLRAIENHARRLASQTAFTDAGRGRFSGLKEIADWCQRARMNRP